MSGLSNDNLQIAKTFKLFIAGEFPRTESGRSFPVYSFASKKVYANLCKASRKDLRNAITAAQGALGSWQARSAYNRGQILYRMAEMLEGKRQEFCEIMLETLGFNKIKANQEVDAAVDSLVYFAGFTDKYQQLIGTVNPVSGPHHNFTSAEAVGLVGLICNEKFDLGELVAQIAAIIASGNSLVALMTTEGAALIAPLAEVLATSDLPKGVVNLLTGELAELYPHFGAHMEVQSLSYQGSDPQVLGELKEMAAGNLKRLVPPLTANPASANPAARKSPNTYLPTYLSLEHLLNYVEYKTVWHPVGY